MDKRWNVFMEQKLSEWFTRKVQYIVVADTSDKARELAIQMAYDLDSFTPLLPYAVLHTVPW